jgi:hypothetical protein
LEEQIEELKEKMAELETALEEKAEPTTAALKEDCEEDASGLRLAGQCGWLLPPLQTIETVQP